MQLFIRVYWNTFINFHTTVIEFRRVCGEPLSKGRQWVGLLPVGLLRENMYLGWEILVAWRGVVTLTERLVAAWY